MGGHEALKDHLVEDVAFGRRVASRTGEGMRLVNADGIDLFGPADAPLALVRGRKRKRFLIRAEKSVDLQGFLAAWRARIRSTSTVRVAFDVDPYSFL